MGIAKEDENTKNLRLNVLHVRGTEDMSTNDVFTYFVDYAPAFIEWINDVSCKHSQKIIFRINKIIRNLCLKINLNIGKFLCRYWYSKLYTIFSH